MPPRPRNRAESLGRTAILPVCGRARLALYGSAPGAGLLGRRQVVRHWILIPAFEGSIPSAPASFFFHQPRSGSPARSLKLRAFVAFAGPLDLLTRFAGRSSPLPPQPVFFFTSRESGSPARRLRSGRSSLSQVHWTCSPASAGRSSPLPAPASFILHPPRVGIPGPSLTLRAFVALAGPLDLLARVPLPPAPATS